MKLYLVNMATLSQTEHFSSALSSDTKSMTSIYFFNFTTSISRPGRSPFRHNKKKGSDHELVEAQTGAF